jgi:hypothetical protein
VSPKDRCEGRSCSRGKGQDVGTSVDHLYSIPPKRGLKRDGHAEPARTRRGHQVGIATRGSTMAEVGILVFAW